MGVSRRARTAWTGLRAALREDQARPGGRRRPRWVSWILACCLTALGAATAGSVFDLARGGGGFALIAGALAGLPFALILVRPLLGWLLSAGGALALAAVLPVTDGDPWPWTIPHGLALLALLFAVCARAGTARAPAAWVVTAALFAWGVPNDIAAGWVVGVSAVAIIGLLAGRLRRSNARLAQQTEENEQEKARRVILEERARIASDLHDIVAHHMSLVVVQAETAPYRIGDLPDTARAELASISATARSALAETRALLTVMRREDTAYSDSGARSDATPPHAPQPGLHQLTALLDASRRAGVRLDADVDGPLDGLRAGTSLAAYRIAQEALANATRHCPDAAVRLVLRRDADALRLHVENAAPTAPGPAGHGITGMRERARAEGGELTVAHTADGRFTLDALLPTGARSP